MEIESYIPDVLKNVREFVSLAAAENPALENVSNAIDTVKAEQFVNTADEAGIKRYEAIVKITPKGTDTLEERKFAVLTKYNAETPFTEKKVNEILTSLCGEGGKLPASTGYLRAVKTVNALGRNLIDAKLFYSYSADGVTITNNKNGSITISGTADSGTYPQSRFNLNLDKGTYYVGCFSDDNNLSYDRVFRVRIYASSSSWHEYTIGSSFTVTGSEYAIIALIQVDGGDTFNGTIWPIITKDSAAVKWEQFTVDSFAEKINWLKNNISAMRCDCWYGYGTSCPSGTEVYFSVYGTSWANYLKSGPMSSSAELLLSLYPAASAYIQSDGFIYFLAYSDACNGAVASTFYTDYISLTIAFK
jgi:hypothetical protein